jgi:hypothetical protein
MVGRNAYQRAMPRQVLDPRGLRQPFTMTKETLARVAKTSHPRS